MLAVGTLNHLLAQNAWAQERLQAYAGKTIKLAPLPIETVFTINETGSLVAAATDAVPDAGIIITPLAGLRLLSGDASGIVLEGDTDLAAVVGKVLSQLQWEYEEDLSKLVGDIPAHELASLGKSAVAEAQRQMTSLAGMFTEYWLEERPLIAKRRDLEKFTAEVDALRDDIERFTKRLDRVEKNS